MHGWMAVTAGLGLMLTSAGAAWAEGARTSPEILALSDLSAIPAPTILRGSAIEPKAAPVVEAQFGDRWQIAAGERLWLVDPQTGEVRSCINRQTSTVGVREIRCTSGERGRFRRTFGRNFNP